MNEKRILSPDDLAEYALVDSLVWEEGVIYSAKTRQLVIEMVRPRGPEQAWSRKASEADVFLQFGSVETVALEKSPHAMKRGPYTIGGILLQPNATGWGLRVPWCFPSDTFPS